MKFENWEVGGFERDTAVDFCRKGISPLVSVLLASRGVTCIDDAKTRIADAPEMIYDPFLMTDMDKAVVKIEQSINAGERIAIYGDYDVDGMTACALIAIYLRSKNVDFEIYIPERIDEGYGLNIQAIDTLYSRGVGLIITVDCGITAIEEAKHAKSLGMGLVITDHHECGEELPEADAVVDPKREDCQYPNKMLAGVGVAFKLVCALEQLPIDEMSRRYGDLVAMGTIADVMPVTGENRELIRRGLRILRSTPRPGLRVLLHALCVAQRQLNTATVGFVLAPRLNAAGRMGKTILSVELLLTENDVQARRLVDELDHLNNERKKIENAIYEEAESMLGDVPPDGPVILASRAWHQGVAGIVAAKMAEKHLLPAIIISVDEDGFGRGSCRSFGRFEIYGALKSCQDILHSFGGHEMAAGITIKEENVDEFRRRINEYYHDNIKLIQKPTLNMDFEVEKPEILTVENIEALECLEPFGIGNRPPILCIKDARLMSVIPIGGGKHTRIKIEKAGKSLDCIYFSVAPADLGVREGMLVDVAFEPQINEFRGRSNVQLLMFDIRTASI